MKLPFTTYSRECAWLARLASEPHHLLLLPAQLRHPGHGDLHRPRARRPHEVRHVQLGPQAGAAQPAQLAPLRVGQHLGCPHPCHLLQASRVPQLQLQLLSGMGYGVVGVFLTRSYLLAYGCQRSFCRLGMTSAVVFQLFQNRLTNLKKRSVILNSMFKPLYLIKLIHDVILLDLNYCCAYMQCLCCNGANLFFRFFGNIVLSYSE